MKREMLNAGESQEEELNPEFVAEVEKSEFSLIDKVNILLTKAGLKPASKIEITSRIWHGKEEERFATDEDLAKARELIENSGMPFKPTKKFELVYSYSPKREDAYNQEGIAYIIGHTQEDLEKLMRALKSKDPALKGEAFGFPPSAVEAFCGKRKKMDFKKLPKNILQTDAFYFHLGPLSEDNWQEELKYDQKKADFIKKISSVLYKKMIGPDKVHEYK